MRSGFFASYASCARTCGTKNAARSGGRPPHDHTFVPPGPRSSAIVAAISPADEIPTIMRRASRGRAESVCKQSRAEPRHPVRTVRMVQPASLHWENVSPLSSDDRRAADRTRIPHRDPTSGAAASAKSHSGKPATTGNFTLPSSAPTQLAPKSSDNSHRAPMLALVTDQDPRRLLVGR